MKQNLYSNIPVNLSEELFTVLAESSGTRIERIVSDGHASTAGFWYDQEENEWIMLVCGSAVLSIENESGIQRIELKPGDYLLIPAHLRHRVESTSQTEKTIWLAVFYSPPAAPGDTEVRRE
jgi:cupin 2 domain-containing protein